MTSTMESGVPIVNYLPDFEGRDRLYDTLDEKPRQIRLIALLKSDDRQSQLQCLLTTTDLGSAEGQYRALSYYWGDPKDTEIVLVGKSHPEDEDAWFEVPVTRNLAAGLREIRAQCTCDGLSCSPHSLWTDAICINQTNIRERNYQVKIMYDIFEASHAVFGWLGELTPEIDESISWCVGLLDWKECPVSTCDNFNIPEFTHIEPIDIQKTTRSSESSLKLLEALAATCSLWDLPYWRRGWVLQEIFVPSWRVFFRCGNRNIPARSIWALQVLISYAQDVLISLFEAHDSDQSYVRGTEKVIERLSPLLHAYNMSKLDVVDLGSARNHSPFNLIGYFETTDPRDLVFSQRNINPLLKTLEPRYEDTLAKVFIDSTLTVLQTTRRWHELSPPEWSEPGDMPSWVIRFGYSKAVQFLLSSLYDAALGATMRVHLEQPRSLIMASTLIDGVLDKLPDDLSHLCVPRPGIAPAKIMSDYYEMAKHFFSTAGPFENVHCPSTSEIWRVICADCVFRGSTQRCTQTDISQLRAATLTVLDSPWSDASSEESDTVSTLSKILEQKFLWDTILLLEDLRLGITEEGRYALLPKDALEGDVVAIFAGCSLPVILRPCETEYDHTVYHYIGVSYIHGE